MSVARPRSTLPRNCCTSHPLGSGWRCAITATTPRTSTARSRRPTPRRNRPRAPGGPAATSGVTPEAGGQRRVEPVRLLLDEMFSPRIADELRRRGHDVVAMVADPELRALSDAAVYAWAAEQDRRVVTENVKGLPSSRHRQFSRRFGSGSPADQRPDISAQPAQPRPADRRARPLADRGRGQPAPLGGLAGRRVACLISGRSRAGPPRRPRRR